MSDGLHVLFGAGQVGSLLAARLLAGGHRVRVAKRSPAGVPSGAETALGDAADAAFCNGAAHGAKVIFHCMNPPYVASTWAVRVPQYMENLIAAAGRNGARLVVLDNLYMLGRPGGRPMDEETPMNPCSKKGEIRARAATRLFDAHQKGEVRAVSGRASDYYGPGGIQTHLGAQFWKPAIAGRTARVLVDPDAVHTYHYIPDVVEGLAALGGAEDDILGRAWMLPCAPAGALRELVERFSQALGRPIRLGTAPRRLIKAIALFVPLLREIQEMVYQWEEPFIVDDRRFRERFKIEPGPVDQAATATVEWARRTYEPK
jgi:nucleoside-diphosphate-sugar epimerase